MQKEENIVRADQRVIQPLTPCRAELLGSEEAVGYQGIVRCHCHK